MMELHFPFLESAILIPLVGAALASRIRDSRRAHRLAMAVTGLTLLIAVGAWQSFGMLSAGDAVVHDRWDLLAWAAGRPILTIDSLSAPLLPMIALLYFLTILTTQKTKIARFAFAPTLLAEAILIAIFACRDPWIIIVLLGLSTLPPGYGLIARGRPARVYLMYMTLFAMLLGVGWTLVSSYGEAGTAPAWAYIPVAAAVLLRSGMLPFHSWLPDLFENGTFGNAILFAVPITGAYAVVRLIVPFAPDIVLDVIAYVAVVTALYAAGVSLVQTDTRRFFSFLFLSHAALVLVGLQNVTAVGLTGALCVWLSIGVALGGLGLTLRAIEARFGRLPLTRYHGLYEHTPALATCFVIVGLASVGFPGTLGFVGTEMLLDGAIASNPFVGVTLLAAMCLIGISIVRVYFLLFTGGRYASNVSMRVGRNERFAVIVLAALLIGGGLFPQRGVASRHAAAESLRRERAALHNGLVDNDTGNRTPDDKSTSASLRLVER